MEHVVAVAENTADELARSDGREVQLEEDPDLQLPFLLPEDGYSCDVVRNIPNGLQEFLDPLCQRGGWRCPHRASELARTQASLALVCRCVSARPRRVRRVLEKLGVQRLGRERPVGTWGQRRADHGVLGVAPAAPRACLVSGYSRRDLGCPSLLGSV